MCRNSFNTLCKTRSNKMLINTTACRKRPLRLQGTLPTRELDLDLDPFMQPNTKLHYDLTVECAEEELLVRGNLNLKIKCLCARCGVWFKDVLTVDQFVRSFDLGGTDTVIDLTPELREDIILSFPSNWICRAECQGLCHVCGVNLNTDACRCHNQTQAAPNVWAALDTLASVATCDKKIMEDSSNGRTKT